MKVYLTNDGFDMKMYEVAENAKPDETVFNIIKDFFSTNDDINPEECIEKMKEDEEDISSLTVNEMCSLFNDISEDDYGFIYSLYPEDYAGSGYYMYINDIDDDLKIRISSHSNEFEDQFLVIKNAKTDPVNGFISVIKEWADNITWNYSVDEEDELLAKFIDEDRRRIEKIKDYINSGKLREEYFEPNEGYDPYNIIQLIDIFNKCNPFETFWMDWMEVEYVHNRWGRYTDQCL